MKRLLITLAILLLASTAFASPYLVCDPAPVDEQVTHYVVSGLPMADGVAVSVDSMGQYGFSLDLAGIAPGTYTASAIACNLWGCSEPATLDFSVVPAGKSGNLRIIKH